MLWYSNVRGAGATLLRRFRSWVKTRRGIKVSGAAFESDVDERVIRVMERLGFRKRGGCFLHYRGQINGTV